MRPLLIIMLQALFLSGCVGGYSFTGASIPAASHTVSIQDFPNRASVVNPLLSTILTDALRNKFTTQTALKMVDYDGDLDLKGEIINYSIYPTAIQGDERASRNRLTITIKVAFQNKQNEKANFTDTFSRFRDYDSGQNLADVEEMLMGEITAELTDDIFNKAVVNW